MLRRNYPASTLLRASPPPTRPSLALAGCPLRLPPLSSPVSRASCAFLRCMPSSLPRRNGKVRVSLTSLATLAFPTYPLGRLPHQSFRGLIERSLVLRPASSRSHQVTLSIEGSDGFVASSAASIATGQATLPRRDFHPLKHTRIHGARISPIMSASVVFHEGERWIPVRVSSPSLLARSCFQRDGHVAPTFAQPPTPPAVATGSPATASVAAARPAPFPLLDYAPIQTSP